jgi:alkanesulfonate monooxygenase SsuD/methylene tetrahydromethanopterin reductase-like flavin-dependent oxidoreductase (luciferase family)
MQFWVFLPQMRMTMDQLSERAQVAEKSGFSGMAGMDHLAPPGIEDAPMFEAMVTNAWVAARTQHLRVSSLVLCDSFRHPVVLAREAVTIDHASGGRFELGIGWGSVTRELDAFGIGPSAAAARLSRLRESIEIIKSLWRGEPFDFEGEVFRLHHVQQRPTPLSDIPLVIGGAGARTMELVAAHADWWNLHVGILDRLDEMRPLSGNARCSIQLQMAFVPNEAARSEVVSTALRRFGNTAVVANAAECVDYFGSLTERGIERVYLWFSDFAAPETLAAFGDGVISQFTRSS